MRTSLDKYLVIQRLVQIGSYARITSYVKARSYYVDARIVQDALARTKSDRSKVLRKIDCSRSRRCLTPQTVVIVLPTVSLVIKVVLGFNDIWRAVTATDKGFEHSEDKDAAFMTHAACGTHARQEISAMTRQKSIQEVHREVPMKHRKSIPEKHRGLPTTNRKSVKEKH